MTNKNEDGFDIRYVKDLVDEIRITNSKHSEILSDLRGIAIETQTILKGHAETQRKHEKKIDNHSMRIRAVERAHDGCTANVEIGAIKKQLNRFMAFKDMIMSKADENSQVIDVHAERMKAAVEAAMTQQVPWKVLLIKMLPWFLLIFITGIVLTTVFITQTMAGNAPDISIPAKVDFKANLSSQESGNEKTYRKN